MNKSMLMGGVLAAIAMTASSAFAAYNFMGGPSYVEVLAVKQIKETVSTPREECRDVTLTKHKPIQDDNRIIGAAVGAVMGGLLGNQVGGGSGKKFATLAGAIGGGYAGSKAQEHLQHNNTYTTTERVCDVEYDLIESIVGYDVSYVVDDMMRTVRMDEDPGRRLQLDEQGRVILTPIQR